jgi:hypothetical protein
MTALGYFQAAQIAQLERRQSGYRVTLHCSSCLARDAHQRHLTPDVGRQDKERWVEPTGGNDHAECDC